MGVYQSRAEGDHVPIRVLRAEDATFQSGVDDHDFGFLAELVVIDFLHQIEDGRVDVGFPAGIITSGVSLCTIVGEVLADLLGQLVLVGIDEAAGEGSAGNLAVFHLHRGQIAGGFSGAFTVV